MEMAKNHTWNYIACWWYIFRKSWCLHIHEILKLKGDFEMLKNQKGISLIKLLIIMAVIIVGIILVVQLTKPRDGILSVEDAEKQYQNALDKKEEADKQYQNALKNAVESQTRLEQLEKGY